MPCPTLGFITEPSAVRNSFNKAEHASPQIPACGAPSPACGDSVAPGLMRQGFLAQCVGPHVGSSAERRASGPLLCQCTRPIIIVPVHQASIAVRQGPGAVCEGFLGFVVRTFFWVGLIFVFEINIWILFQNRMFCDHFVGI